ncbi:hypothetical protein llg_45750 [Luteolibacter sp. LG18]|nr:hypothetical protein llg_45750 [Luteolibacter sp. LG18]
MMLEGLDLRQEILPPALRFRLLSRDLSTVLQTQDRRHGTGHHQVEPQVVQASDRWSAAPRELAAFEGLGAKEALLHASGMRTQRSTPTGGGVAALLATG